MTFQVFDKMEGIPPLPADPTDEKNMPVGKGSIEVMRVGAGSSECKIIRATPGQSFASETSDAPPRITAASSVHFRTVGAESRSYCGAESEF